MLRLQLFNWHFYKFIIWISLVPYLTGMVKLHNRSLLGRWNKPECSHLNVVCTPESTGSCWSELVDCILRLLFRNRKVLSWGLRLTLGISEVISLSFCGVFAAGWDLSSQHCAHWALRMSFPQRGGCREAGRLGSALAAVCGSHSGKIAVSICSPRLSLLFATLSMKQSSLNVIAQDSGLSLTWYCWLVVGLCSIPIFHCDGKWGCPQLQRHQLYKLICPVYL